MNNQSVVVIVPEPGVVISTEKSRTIVSAIQGSKGDSAYQVAVSGGYNGSQVQWLASLKGVDGKSAYQIAVEAGYSGTEPQWLSSLHGAPPLNFTSVTSSGGLVALDFSASRNFNLSVNTNFTLSPLTNLTEGQVGIVSIHNTSSVNITMTLPRPVWCKEASINTPEIVLKATSDYLLRYTTLGSTQIAYNLTEVRLTDPVFTITTFTLTSSLGGLSFTRSTTAQTIDFDGTFISASSGNPLFGSKGILLEPQTTNYLNHSQNITSGGWQAYGGGSFIGSNVATAPDGAMTADSISLATTGTSSNIYQYPSGIPVTSTVWTFTVWIKRNAVTDQTFQLLLNSAGTLFYSSDLIATNTWQRFKITSTTSSTNAVLAGIIGNSSGVQADLLVWQGQLTPSGSVVSDIPTNSASLTRVADVLHQATTGNINAGLGELFLEYTPHSVINQQVTLLGTEADSNNETYITYDGTTLTFRKCVAGVNYDATVTINISAGITYSIKIEWGEVLGMKITCNGISGTNTNTLPLPLGVNLYIGSDGKGLNQCNGYIKNVQVSK